MTRLARKHYAALIAIAIYNLVLFAPLFAGRLISPNDIYYQYEPWSLQRPHDLGAVRNPLLIDPPTSYYTLISLLRHEPDAFHWNPYIASGAPGFGSSAAAVLSPFILVPAFAVPPVWVFTAIIFLKLNVAFWFAWLWLREERVGKVGAASGAIVVAGAGIYAVRWMWQATNATALYPALLWLVCRSFRDRRTPLSAIILLGVAYALAGFPAAMAYGFYLAVAYALFLTIRFRGLPLRRTGELLIGGAIALAIAAPSLVPFASWIGRSGYLQMRALASSAWYPLSHWRSFIFPDRLGNPAMATWIGDPALGGLNNYVEATIYVGLVAIPLTLLALFARRRDCTRGFWLGVAFIVLAAMFGMPRIAPAIGALPGFKYSMLGRINALLPPSVGYLAACGVGWLLPRIRRGSLRMVFAIVLTATTAFDLAAFAARFQPYLRPAQANVPSTPTIDFLRSQPGPFRVAPFFSYLWPNTSELFRIEDVRSHFTSEEAYRRLLLRVDPGAWSGKGTYLGFSSLHFDFDDPIVGMLGIRYFIEPRSVDVIKWKTLAATTPGMRQEGDVPFIPGTRLRRAVVTPLPYWALELPVDLVETVGSKPHLLVTVEKDGRPVWTRAFSPDDLRALGKVYIPLRPYAKVGEPITLDIRSFGLRGSLYRGDGAAAGEASIYYGLVDTPVVFDRDLPDGRIFLNLAELPRFHAVERVYALDHEQFLADREIDPAVDAVITDGSPVPALGKSDADVRLVQYQPARQQVSTSAGKPFFLASSEKVSPELRITIDGRDVHAIEIDTLFAGVVVPAGRHDVIFSRRLARGWWPVAAAGVAVWLVIALIELIAAWSGRRQTLR